MNKKDFLQANAASIEERFTYFKSLTEEELSDLKEDYFRNLSKIEEAENELEKAKAIFKETVAVPKKELQELRATIKNKGRMVSEVVYLIPDYAELKMNYVNSDGETVSSRKMLPNERQMNLSIAANNDDF